MTQTQAPRAGEARGDRRLVTPSGRDLALPLFLPVHQANSVFGAFRAADDMDLIRGCICNAYFLYKQADLRTQLTGGTSVHEFLGFDGLVMTDSGAFQQFSRALYLSNRKIVKFQRAIGADVVSPLDVVTSPGENHQAVLRKVDATARRVKEAQQAAEGTLLAGVQQGGRFLDLRQRSTEQMMELGVGYLALGSLVPFFTRAHDLRFVAKTLRATREQVPADLPIHIYGAGDPLELPFFAYLGADVFDSASYAHYARSGWYMTPFGAVRDPGPLTLGEGFSCGCPRCAAHGAAGVLADPEALSLHNLWTVLTVAENMRAATVAGTMAPLLERVLTTHSAWFPDSPLRQHWDELLG
jgi:7-cyano-7-deazaguanine tRNA-ribosyltransferase